MAHERAARDVQCARRSIRDSSAAIWAEVKTSGASAPVSIFGCCCCFCFPFFEACTDGGARAGVGSRTLRSKNMEARFASANRFSYVKSLFGARSKTRDFTCTYVK